MSLPNTDLVDWSYSDKKLKQLFTATKSDIQIGILDHPIEQNFFSRRLSDNSGIVSFYQIDEIAKGNNIDLLNYLLVVIYKYITIYNCNEKKFNESISFLHDETRGCIFDMCGIKTDIVSSITKPQLCYECESKMRHTTLEDRYIEILKKELNNIKKPLYYRMLGWIKRHPILSLLITVVSTISINITSNALYELIKQLLP